MYNYPPILLVLHILQQEVLVETVSDTQLTKCIKARILNQLNRELKQVTFLSTRTSAGSKSRRYRWRMMASAVLI